jgi:hypothetical protein
MSVLPANYRGGTTLNPQITTYETLALRVKRQLGHPLVNIEISDEQLYDNITDAIEYFTKWAGHTEEFLIFDSRLYKRGIGIDVGTMVNTTPEMYNSQTAGLSASYDYDLASYRKVVDCFSFNYGESTGINTLFTLEQALSQQIYSSYMLGSFGYDLTTWEVLKQFIDLRTKVLAMTPHFRFDNRKQILRIIPEPVSTESYYGVVGCYLERPIKDTISERWVFKYTLALTKIAVAHVRGKIKGTALMGGGTINADDFMQQGLKEKDELEKDLMNSYTDNNPPMFFLG